MKSFIIAMLITAAMIGCSIAYTNHLDKISLRLSEECITAEQYISGEDFESAADCIDGIISYIHRKKLVLAATLDHTELDRIESTLSELRAYTIMENKTDALAKTSALKLYIEHLPKNYKLKIENIL